jgi:hypothetical protein
MAEAGQGGLLSRLCRLILKDPFFNLVLRLMAIGILLKRLLSLMQIG